MRLLAIVSLLAAVVPQTVSGQGLQVGPRVGVGDGSAFTAQVGVRADVLWSSWGVYGVWGVRTTTVSCALSDPCRFGPLWELAAGLSGEPRGTPLYVSVGAGALRWEDGTDVLFEGELGLRFPVGRKLTLGAGVHSMLAPNVHHPNVPAVGVQFVELVLGLAYELRASR